MAQQLKNPPATQETLVDPWVGKIPWRKKWQLTPVFLPGKSHGQRILAGSSPWGHKRVRHDLEIKQQQTFSSVQSLSRVRLCDPMNGSTPGLPVNQQLSEFTQTHVRRDCDAIQPSHPLSSPSPPAPNPSQHQGQT